MARPCKNRKIDKDLEFTCFKPIWVDEEKLSKVELECDEIQAIKLAHYDNLSQSESAKQMEISAPTFNRILKSWYKKVADALVNAKAIKAVK